MAFEPKEECSHSFTEVEYWGMLVGIEDLKNQIKIAQKTARAMKKVVENQTV